MGSFFLFLSFGRGSSLANDTLCIFSPYEINPSLKPDRFYSPLPLILREASNILVSSVCSWEPSLKVVHQRTNDGNAFERECSLTFQGNMHFVHWVCLNQTIYHILHLNTELLQTRTLTCMVISKSFFTFWYPTHCLREISLKDAKENLYCRPCGNNQKMCQQLWEDVIKLWNMERGRRLIWVWRCGSVTGSLAAQLAGELTSLLPLDCGRSWWGEAVIQDSDIPVQWRVCHEPLL